MSAPADGYHRDAYGRVIGYSPIYPIVTDQEGTTLIGVRCGARIVDPARFHAAAQAPNPFQRSTLTNRAARQRQRWHQIFAVVGYLAAGLTVCCIVGGVLLLLVQVSR